MSNWLNKMRSRGLLRKPSGLRMTEKLDPTGHLLVRAIRAKDGKIVQEIEGKNLVVNLGREAMAHAIAGDDLVDFGVASMEFGDGTGTPAVTDTTMFGAVIIVKPVTFSFPVVVPPTQVAFVATVGQFEGNGSGSQDYREAGLLTGNSALFSHKVFGLITKTSDLIIQATWTITF